MENKRRKSSGRFEERICRNPNCCFERSFQPTRKTHVFCIPQCRINFYNDLQSSENAGIYLNAKKLKAIDKKLGKMYDVFSSSRKKCFVHKDVFEYEQIDTLLLVTELITENNEKLKVYFRYGLTVSAENSNFFFIHKLKK
jgi:hypothetical protein